MLDWTGYPIFVGNRIRWRNQYSFFGEVIDLRDKSYQGDNAGRILVKWEHRENPTWHLPGLTTVIRIDEEAIKRFMDNFEGEGKCLGKAFLRRFNMKDEKLKREKCPGKALRRIVDFYAGDA